MISWIWFKKSFLLNSACLIGIGNSLSLDKVNSSSSQYDVEHKGNNWVFTNEQRCRKIVIVVVYTWRELSHTLFERRNGISSLSICSSLFFHCSLFLVQLFIILVIIIDHKVHFLKKNYCFWIYTSRDWLSVQAIR